MTELNGLGKKCNGRMVVFKSTFNCSHANFKPVIQRNLTDLDCIVSYNSTSSFAYSRSREIAHA